MAAVVKKTWFEDMIEALSEVKRDAHGNIPSEQYCNAIARIPGIYDALFGNVPPVVSVLKADIENGVLRVRNACAAAPVGKKETLQAMCTHLIDTVGAEACRNDNTSGIRCLLWLNRASTFITQLIKGILEGDEPHVAADKAYVAFLQPQCPSLPAVLMYFVSIRVLFMDATGIRGYVPQLSRRVGRHQSHSTFPFHRKFHPRREAAEPRCACMRRWHGWMMGKFVQQVMYAAPPKEKMFRWLELPSEEEALKQMREYVALMEPICSEILAFMEEIQCNWPDKA